MKEKILLAFKAKYPGINLSKKRLDAIAAKIEAKVIDDETKIDASLAAMDEVYPFADIAKDDDKIRTLEAKIKAPKKEEGETPEQKAAREAAEAAAALADDKDTPPYIKKMMESFDSIKSELAQIKGEKVQSTILTKLEKEHLKEVPKWFWEEWKLPETEDAIPAFTEKAISKFAAMNQERTEAGLGALSAPKAGSGGKDGKVTPASKEELTTVLDNIM